MLTPFEETVHFALAGRDAAREWEWTEASPTEDGNLRLGPRDRVVNVALAHQMHCLRTFRIFLASEHPPRGRRDVEHAEHCLTMLREMTLCDADATLEEGDVFARNWTIERSAGERRCSVDVEAFYDTLAQGWNDWEAKKASLKVAGPE